VLALMTVILAVGLFRHSFLRRTVHGLELFNGRIGQFACWFALIMMIQQVLIIVMGQIFRGNELVLSPFGLVFSSGELQWLSGQLKLYNAILIALASAYTFIEGGHVRVDLIYAKLPYRKRKIFDLAGTLIFFFPSSILLWWFAWPLAMNSMFSQRPLNVWSTKASWRGFKWESSGTAEFTWVWAFKLLILFFAALLIIQAFTFLLRNVMALRETEEIETHPRLDRGEETAPAAADANAVEST
jgi:TRAP-type mannitol/chloroaromatic compound transport system permease small subunit